jgi:hypothetical protein
MSIAWRPANEYFSAFLQSAGHNPLNPPILKQIAAKAQQTFEQFAVAYKDSEVLRANQSVQLKAVLNSIQEFATGLGIEVFDISLTKCDYSTDDQKIRNKTAEGEIVVKLTDKLYNKGKGGYTTRADAARAASLILGVENMSDHKSSNKNTSVFKVEIDATGITPEASGLLAKMDLDALAIRITDKLNSKGNDQDNNQESKEEQPTKGKKVT